MKKGFLIILACLFCLAPVDAKRVKTPKNKKEKVEKTDYAVQCIAFYNLENLFDTIHDQGKNDFEYLPDGGMHWDGIKYTHKIHNMAYAISQLGTDYLPKGAACVGVTEVENMHCMQDLCAELKTLGRNYEPILLEGPDRRGIDVGFLYDPDYFTVVSVTGDTLHAHYSNGNQVNSRLQLHVTGYLMGEKIHIVVNHWPSRYGGELDSRPTRDTAAMLCKDICERIYAKEPNAKIVLMGDLNDDPYNHSCKDILQAKMNREEVGPQGLFNTMWRHLENGNGSLAYNGSWNLFDQIIISEPLLNADRKKWTYWKSQIFNKPFLTVQEGKDKGTPLRTVKSNVWQDGYGDHYPTLIYVIREKK